MEKLFMSAGIVTTIVLCFVGIIKLPFKTFKSKHPVAFRIVFNILSIILSAGLCVIDELYILSGDLISFEFVTLVLTVFAGVFTGYNGVYEGLGIKDLFKKIGESIKKAQELAQDEKVKKYLNKYLNNIEDIDKAIALLEERKNNSNGEV